MQSSANRRISDEISTVMSLMYNKKVEVQEPCLVVLLIILVEDLIVHHLSQLAGNDSVEMKKSIHDVAACLGLAPRAVVG